MTTNLRVSVSAAPPKEACLPNLELPNHQSKLVKRFNFYSAQPHEEIPRVHRWLPADFSLLPGVLLPTRSSETTVLMSLNFGYVREAAMDQPTANATSSTQEKLRRLGS